MLDFHLREFLPMGSCREGLRKLGLSSQKVAELLTTVFSKQIFIDGFVHCDPHPGRTLNEETFLSFLLTRLVNTGNVLLRRLEPSNMRSDEPELVLLDHGLYRELDDEFR